MHLLDGICSPSIVHHVYSCLCSLELEESNKSEMFIKFCSNNDNHSGVYYPRS